MSEEIIAHYTNGIDLIEAIREGLAKAGKDNTPVKTADLAAVDEFHIRGREATLELVRAMNLNENSVVLDIGCGIGGPARTVAETYGCRVIGIDLSPTYCDVANELSAWTSLDQQVAFQPADATVLPFENASFDAAFTIHVGMNIIDKNKVYAEAHRVLRPGGVFAVYDVLRGDGGEVYFPVPWARDSSISFLVTPAEMRQLLEGAGFQILGERDSSREGYEWFNGALTRMRESESGPLSLRVLLGDEFRLMAENITRSLAERRALVCTFISRK